MVYSCRDRSNWILLLEANCAGDHVIPRAPRNHHPTRNLSSSARQRVGQQQRWLIHMPHTTKRQLKRLHNNKLHVEQKKREITIC